MKKLLYLPIFLMTMLFSCQKDVSADQNTLAGNYKTNASFDFSCALISADKLPKLQISKVSDNIYQVKIIRFFPNNTTEIYSNITTKAIAGGLEFTYKNLPAGKWVTQKYWDDSSEKEGKFLSFLIDNQAEKEFVYFAGIKE